MAANYVLLEKITVGAAGAASVTFNNIPQTGYTDLKIVASWRGNSASSVSIYMSLNGSASSFTGKYLYGDGSATSSGSIGQYVGSCPGSNFTANTFASTEIYIPNYTSANYKSFSVDNVDETNATASDSNLIAGLWSNTAAITSISIAPSGSSFIQYSTFSLYGLAAVGATPAINPKATGGDIIQTDGTYWYHAFLSSGTFTPKVGLTCDVLVVAGGGGGMTGKSATYYGSGGGSGQVSLFTSQALTPVSYTTTVGSGGAGADATSLTTNGGTGSNSQFGSLAAAAGGGGGLYNTGYGGTSGNGYSGGGPNGAAAGGGGGAAGVGGNATSNTVAGVGGIGLTNATINAMAGTTLTGQNVSGTYYYGGGGGGEAGGVWSVGGYGGGGGAAGGTAGPYDATANTGGGGAGGAYSTIRGGNGGSGVIIVRYTVA
jgi:hypothetical protein